MWADSAPLPQETCRSPALLGLKDIDKSKNISKKPPQSTSPPLLGLNGSNIQVPILIKLKKRQRFNYCQQLLNLTVILKRASKSKCNKTMKLDISIIH